VLTIAVPPARPHDAAVKALNVTPRKVTGTRASHGDNGELTITDSDRTTAR